METEFNTSEFWNEVLFITGASITGGPIGGAFAYITYKLVKRKTQ